MSRKYHQRVNMNNGQHHDVGSQKIAAAQAKIIARLKREPDNAFAASLVRQFQFRGALSPRQWEAAAEYVRSIS